MKKFFKAISALALTAGAAYGAYTLYQKFMEKEKNTEDSFDDDFEEEHFKEGKGKREYVTIDIEDEDASI